MIRSRPAAALCAALILPSCIPSPEPEPIYSACRGVLASSDWQARVELDPSASPIPYFRRKLVVTGKVTTAGGGSMSSLDPGPVERLDDPVQQVILRTEGTAGPAPAPSQNVRADLPGARPLWRGGDPLRRRHRRRDRRSHHPAAPEGRGRHLLSRSPHRPRRAPGGAPAAMPTTLTRKAIVRTTGTPSA